MNRRKNFAEVLATDVLSKMSVMETNLGHMLANKLKNQAPKWNDHHDEHKRLVDTFLSVAGLTTGLNVLLQEPFDTRGAFKELVQEALQAVERSQTVLWSKFVQCCDCPCDTQDLGIEEIWEAALVQGAGASILRVSDSYLTASEAGLPPREILVAAIERELSLLPNADLSYSETLKGIEYLNVETYALPGFLVELITHRLSYHGNVVPALEVVHWPHNQGFSRTGSDYRRDTILRTATDCISEACNKYIEHRNFQALFALSDAEMNSEWKLQKARNGAEISIEIKKGFGTYGLLVDGLEALWEGHQIDRALYNPLSEEETQLLIENTSETEHSMYVKELSEALYKTVQTGGWRFMLPNRLLPRLGSEHIGPIDSQETPWMD